MEHVGAQQLKWVDYYLDRWEDALCLAVAGRPRSRGGVTSTDMTIIAAKNHSFDRSIGIIVKELHLKTLQYLLQLITVVHHTFDFNVVHHFDVVHPTFDVNSEVAMDENILDMCRPVRQRFLCNTNVFLRGLVQSDDWTSKVADISYIRVWQLPGSYIADRWAALMKLLKVQVEQVEQGSPHEAAEGPAVEGYNYIEQALKQNNSSFSVHKWFAILSGERGGFLGVTERIKSGGIFKKHLDIALSLKPQDTSVHHLLGMFNYKVSMLNWFERTVAETLFGDVPDTSFEQAIHHFLEARKYGAICWKANDLYIAKCHIEDGNYADAALWLERAHSLAILSDNDARMHEEVTELLEYYQEYRIRSPDDEDPARESCPTVLKNPQEVKENSSSDHCFSSWIIFLSTIVYLFSS
ncbi:unnamed protein product, partial [Meganyctiphanes norvegica]